MRARRGPAAVMFAEIDLGALPAQAARKIREDRLCPRTARDIAPPRAVPRAHSEIVFAFTAPRAVLAGIELFDVFEIRLARKSRRQKSLHILTTGSDRNLTATK